MELTVVEGTSNPPLAAAVREGLGLPPAPSKLQRFPDGELQVEITANVRGHDVYIVQGTHAPVGEHLLELLLYADAYRRGGASRITVLAPYLGYVRQDRRSHGRESLGARLMADVLQAGRLDRLVSVDLHAPAVEGCFTVPLEHLTAVPLLAEAARPRDGGEAVVVSPDLGAVKLAERYAAALNLPLAIVHKTRISGAAVQAHGVVGDVRGKTIILVDDMISTAGTVEAAVRAAIEDGAKPGPTVVATHGLLVGPAMERLARVEPARLITSDSVPPPAAHAQLKLERPSLAPLLSETVRRLYEGKPLLDLVAHR
jgi:ribose-phosphate pyrophosphokinase